MAARNRTHPAEQAKAWITFFLALLGLISLAVGGITHFIGVLQRLLLGSFVLILFGAGVLVVINSRLILLRKFGVVLVLASALAWLVWWEIKPPRTWQPTPFRVVRVDAPSARTRGLYSFNLPQPKGFSLAQLHSFGNGTTSPGLRGRQRTRLSFTTIRPLQTRCLSHTSPGGSPRALLLAPLASRKLGHTRPSSKVETFSIPSKRS